MFIHILSLTNNSFEENIVKRAMDVENCYSSLKAIIYLILRFSGPDSVLLNTKMYQNNGDRKIYLLFHCFVLEVIAV